jgi:hypothetical protein
LTGLSCLAVGAVIGYRAADAALTRSVQEQLTAQREIKRRRIESYINNQVRFTAAMADLPETTEAAKAFILAFKEMRAEAQESRGVDSTDTEALEAWYNKDLLPRLDKIAAAIRPWKA